MTVLTRVEGRRGTSRAGRGTQLLMVAFVIVLVVGTLTTDGFYTIANAKAVVNSAAIIGIVAIGVTAIVLGGQLFSLSIGTTVAICAMAFLYSLRFGMLPAIVLTAVLGAVLVGLQGYLIGRLGANAIIVTIGAGALQEGGITWITNGVSVYPPSGGPDFSVLARPLFGIPFPVYVFVALTIIGQFLLTKTVHGRQLMLMGENSRAARAGALPITKLTVVAFAAAGFTAGIAGVLLGAFNQSGTLTATGTLTYDSIAAVLVGGTAVTGGRGSVVRTAVGAVLMAAVADMLLLRGYSTPVQVTVLGVIVACVILINHLNSNERGRS